MSWKKISQPSHAQLLSRARSRLLMRNRTGGEGPKAVVD
jgi:hypothetical protein